MVGSFNSIKAIKSRPGGTKCRYYTVYILPFATKVELCYTTTCEMDSLRLGESHSHLNSLRESIQFTIEKEQNDSLPFLDTPVMKEGQHMTMSIHG